MSNCLVPLIHALRTREAEAGAKESVITPPVIKYSPDFFAVNLFSPTLKLLW